MSSLSCGANRCSHLIGEELTIYYIHFWADLPLAEVVRELRATLDASREARMRWWNAAICLAAMLAGVTVAPRHVLAQQSDRSCVILCEPSLNVEPTLTIENLIRRHRVQNVSGGEIMRAERATEFEMVLALDIPTTIPRLGLTFEAIWAPFASGSSNPFTGASAGDIGESEIRDNPVELEFELNLDVLDAAMTNGWLGAHFDIVDQFSPAERPHDAGVYTHKLDFELDTALAPFNFLEAGWLRHVELEASFDYLATGLPRAGDVVPIGETRYLDNASPWSLSFVLVLPIAPLGS